MTFNTLKELRPNRDLLNPNFEGYKVSLQPLKVLEKSLIINIRSCLPNSDHLSLLYYKLFGLHNYLYGFNESVYIINKEFSIIKFYYNSLNDEICEEILYKLPLNDCDSHPYPPSMKFIDNFAFVSDGLGILYLFNRIIDDNDQNWQLLFSEDILIEKSFIIKDCQYNDNNFYLLLLRIDKNDDNHIKTIINWVSLSKIDDKWEYTTLKEIESHGEVQYVSFDNIESFYVISQKGCKSVYDSDESTTTKVSENLKPYNWTQNGEEISIKIPEKSIDKHDVNITIDSEIINVKIKSKSFISGKLFHTIDSDLTTWNITNDCLEIFIFKSDSQLVWTDLLISENELSHLTSSRPESPINGLTFNSQQVEDCDFETDKEILLERINKLCQITHQMNLGINDILFTLNDGSFGLRYDVDICIWKIRENFDSIDHIGTLFAMGYVQASKQRKKFLTTNPNFTYTAIAENNTHVFIYQQKKKINSQLRNRINGELIDIKAEQQIFKFGNNEEIMGIFATNTGLFLLSESFIKFIVF